MATIKDGEIIDKNVDIRISPTLEHGNLTKLNAIVLHRTAGSTASGTLSMYKNGTKIGAHFLIAKSGQIYQTAHMNKECWHVGIMYSRCKIGADCTVKELKTIKALLHEKGQSLHDRFVHLSRHEALKPYPERYPSNADSIGIEVVGRYIKRDNAYEEPTAKQYLAVKWLVKCVVNNYDLNTRTDVYAHGEIAHKKPSEGIDLLESLVTGGVK